MKSVRGCTQQSSGSLGRPTGLGSLLIGRALGASGSPHHLPGSTGWLWLCPFSRPPPPCTIESAPCTALRLSLALLQDCTQVLHAWTSGVLHTTRRHSLTQFLPKSQAHSSCKPVVTLN